MAAPRSSERSSFELDSRPLRADDSRCLRGEGRFRRCDVLSRMRGKSSCPEESEGGITMRNAALAVAVLALAVALPIADAKKKPPGSGNGNSGAASWPIQTPRGHRAATAHRLASAPDEDGDWTDQAQKDEPRVTGAVGAEVAAVTISVAVLIGSRLRRSQWPELAALVAPPSSPDGRSVGRDVSSTRLRWTSAGDNDGQRRDRDHLDATSPLVPRQSLPPGRERPPTNGYAARPRAPQSRDRNRRRTVRDSLQPARGGKHSLSHTRPSPSSFTCGRASRL